jgi:hypothetical protein
VSRSAPAVGRQAREVGEVGVGPGVIGDQVTSLRGFRSRRRSRTTAAQRAAVRYTRRSLSQSAKATTEIRVMVHLGPPFVYGLSQHVEHCHRGVPIDAGIGDAAAIG